MTNINYMKCRTCRFCVHIEEKWKCSLTRMPTGSGETCARYRPGSCENCSYARITDNAPLCSLRKDETDTLSVCSEYDPCGRRSV